jgi:hypothetical protein
MKLFIRSPELKKKFDPIFSNICGYVCKLCYEKRWISTLNFVFSTLKNTLNHNWITAFDEAFRELFQKMMKIIFTKCYTIEYISK